jgi:hypothetical protein
MLDFLSRLKRNRIWSIAVYVENGDFTFHKKVRSPRFVLDSKRLRNRSRHIHTFADPFLFPFKDELYMFFESQAVSESGKIEALKTRDLVNFEYVGEILREPFHLSFPFVFEHESEIYLMPESYVREEVALYKFVEFPHKLEKCRVLLKGAYRDSSLIRHDGTWYFFTTSNDGLELFYTDDLEHGHLIPHRHNPLTEDPRYSQCGGSPILFQGAMYRISQDCSTEYGKNISVLRINELSKDRYHEEVVVDDYFDLKDSWNARGGHHLSIAPFNGKLVIAVDGKQDDLFVNKLLSLIYPS